MNRPEERPVSGSTVLVMVVLAVLGALLVLRWILSTVNFFLNTVLVVAVVAGVAYLFLRSRSD